MNEGFSEENIKDMSVLELRSEPLLHIQILTLCENFYTKYLYNEEHDYLDSDKVNRDFNRGEGERDE